MTKYSKNNIQSTACRIKVKRRRRRKGEEEKKQKCFVSVLNIILKISNVTKIIKIQP